MLKELDALTQPIIDIYNSIEMALLVEIAKRFDTYDSIGGSLQWQIKKLDELGALNSQNIKIIAHYSSRSELEIKQMLNQAGYANIDMSVFTKAFKNGVIPVNPAKMMESPVIKGILEHSFKELQGTYKLIQTKALESAKQNYMDVLNQTYIEVATGTKDYNTAIRQGLQRMTARGITGATYKRGCTTVKYSLEGTVRRDTLTTVNQLANKVAFSSCDELGVKYVEISSHLGARVSLNNPIANHAGWQGKVFRLEGSEKKYPNLKESTGYPDDILGLGGVNCRHRMFPFIPGISVPNPIQYDEEENRKIYEATKKQRAMERKMRLYKKQHAVAYYSDDDETMTKLKVKMARLSSQIEQFCKENGLIRDVSRENITY